MKHRRAVSLIELMVVMSGCTAILTLSAVLLHRTLHTQSRARAFLDVERSGLRLSNQFRRDVHQAKTASTTDLPDNTALRLKLNDKQTIDYHYAAGIMLRRVVAGDRTVSREEFAFPSNSQLEIERDESPPLVTLSLTCGPSHADGPAVQSFAIPVNIQVQAHLGRAAHFADAPADREE